MNEYSLNTLKIAAIIVFLSLVPILFFYDNSTALVWTVVIPIVPIFLIVVGYSNWRKICPLAFLANLSQNLRWIEKRKVPKWFEENFYYFQYSLLFIAFTARLTTLNFDSFYLGVFFVFVVIASFLINLVFTGKSWCNFFCPVSVVEKIYCGSNAQNYNNNSACSTCSACKKNCPDIDMESSYWKETINNQKAFVFYSFPGLVLGFYLYFYMQSGTLEYYFSGTWTNQDVSMFSSGFFFAPFIPVILAAPITLAIFSMLSFYLFQYIEQSLWKKKVFKNILFATLKHRIKVFSAFVAFNIFYIFAGAPAYIHFPIPYAIFHFLVIAVSTIVLYREIFREESYFIQERFAIKMIKRWTSEKPVPSNLKEIYYTYSNEKANKSSKLKTYKESLVDLLKDGILTSDSMMVLEKLREQMGITKEEHFKIIKEIKLNNEELFDENIDKSAERRHQKNSYKRMIEEALLDHEELSPTVLKSIQKQFHISNEEHHSIVNQIMNTNERLKEDVVSVLEEMQLLSLKHNAIYDDENQETSFLKYAIREEFNNLSIDLFMILNIIYDENSEELKELENMLKYHDDVLVMECNESIFNFLDKTILDGLINLKFSVNKEIDSSIDNNIEIIKYFIDGKYLDLSNVALLNLKNYELSEYSDIDLNKFLSSYNHNISELANKISTKSNDLVFYEIIMYLQSVGFFSNIQFKELASLAKLTKLIEFSKNEVIIEQGEIGDALYILVDGEVEVEVNKKVVATLHTGTCFGEIAIVANIQRTATIRATTPIKALKLLEKDFTQFIEDNPRISVKLMKDIIDKLLQNANG